MTDKTNNTRQPVKAKTQKVKYPPYTPQGANKANFADFYTGSMLVENIRFHTNLGLCIGGSFYDAPKGDRYFTINLMKEQPKLKSNHYLPIKDFSIPTQQDLETAVLTGIKALRRGKVLFVGCMGGTGRTGLYYAALLKALGSTDPIAHVRTAYKEHAVETGDQRKLVSEFGNTLLFRFRVKLALIF